MYASTNNVIPSITEGIASFASSSRETTLSSILPPNSASASPSSPSVRALLSSETNVVEVSVAFFNGSSTLLYMVMPKPSSAEFNSVERPFKLSFIVIAICSAAPLQSFIYPDNSS